MALWPFNRKKKESSDLPKEVQDYYQAEKRERVGVAGMLAVATLVVTVLLAMGLFFGGRWAYRTIFDDDQPGTAQQEGQKGQEGQPAGKADEGDQQAATSEPSPTPAPQPSTPEPTTPPTPSPQPTRTSSTSTAADLPGSGLPDTGPADTAAIVLSVASLSGAGFYILRHRENQEQE